MTQNTLYEKYGGFSQINRIVMAFYDAMLDSEEIGPYFDDVDMAALVDHQTKFISQVMGGPASYSNEVLEQVHRRLNITQQAFEEMTGFLEETLVEYGFTPEDVRSVMVTIKSCQPYIVTKG